MESYFGDIKGGLEFRYHDGEKIVTYIQDVSILLRYGCTVESTCIWDVCCCEVHDNNQPYCWNCWDSRDQQKAESNLDELRKTRYTMTIERKAYEHSIRPWIDEYNAIFDPCCTHVEFDWADYSLIWYGEYDTPCGPNGNLLGQYILFKQIEFFFKTMTQDECIVFANEHPI